MDIISNLGEMVFAGRLKKIGEGLAKDVTIFHHKLDIDFETHRCSVFFNLCCDSYITVTSGQGCLIMYRVQDQCTHEEKSLKLILNTMNQKRSER